MKSTGLTAVARDRMAVTSAGVDVGPLAAFSLLGLLAFTNDLSRLRADRGAHVYRPIHSKR